MEIIEIIVDTLKAIGPIISAMTTVLYFAMKFGKKYVDDIIDKLEAHVKERDKELGESLQNYIKEKADSAKFNVKTELRDDIHLLKNEISERFDHTEEIRRTSLKSVYTKIDEIEKRSFKLEILNEEKDKVIKEIKETFTKFDDKMNKFDNKMNKFDEKLTQILLNTKK